MIRAMAFFTAFFLPVAAWPQALVDFANHRMFETPADRLVRDISGAPLVGQNYLAQLYYGAEGASQSSLSPVTAAPATFRASTTDLPGTWIGGERRLSGFSIGDFVVLQVRVWDGTVAPSYETAEALNFLGTQHGVSEPFTYRVPSLSQPSWLFYIENFRGFTLVPEPSIVALAVLGIGGVLLLKRRRK
jgi:hypothetical protein